MIHIPGKIELFIADDSPFMFSDLDLGFRIVGISIMAASGVHLLVLQATETDSPSVAWFTADGITWQIPQLKTYGFLSWSSGAIRVVFEKPSAADISFDRHA